MYHMSSVWSNTCNNSCFCSAGAVCCVARTVSEQQSPKLEVSEYERYRRVRWRELSLIHFSYKCYYAILLQIKLQYILLGDYWVCVLPPRLPVLTRVTSSVLPGNNIWDTFLIGSATDTTLTRQLFAHDYVFICWHYIMWELHVVSLNILRINHLVYCSPAFLVV